MENLGLFFALAGAVCSALMAGIGSSIGVGHAGALGLEVRECPAQATARANTATHKKPSGNR